MINVTPNTFTAKPQAIVAIIPEQPQIILKIERKKCIKIEIDDEYEYEEYIDQNSLTSDVKYAKYAEETVSTT